MYKCPTHNTAGWLTRASQLYSSVAAIQFAVGQGADVFVGPGGAVLALNAYLYPPAPISYVNPGCVAKSDSINHTDIPHAYRN